MITIGIDPGLTGALGMLGHRGEYLQVADIPVMTRQGARAHVAKQVNGAALEELLRTWTVAYDKNEIQIVIETPIAFPGLHISAVAASFLTAGIIEGVVAARHYPHALVRPTDWKKALKLGRDKEQARAMAIRLYPEASSFLSRVRDHNRAEAILLARFGHERYA